MKRFHNARRCAFRYSLIGLAGALLLGSCTKVDDTLGGNLIPDNQQMRAGFVTIDGTTKTIDGLNPRRYVETRLFKTDSIVGSNLSYGYFGTQMNDSIGTRTAGFLTQMVSYYAVPEGYFGYMPIFDSAQILLSIKSLGRDSLTEQHFAVYEIRNNDYITQRERSDTVFYLGFTPDKQTVNTDEEPLFRFTLGGEDKSPSTTSAVTMTATQQGEAYIRRLMLQEGTYKDKYSIYTTDSLKYFIEEFPGLYIAPDPAYRLDKTGKSNVGTIFATQLDASGLSIYGRNRVKGDPALIQDTIGMVLYFYDSYASNGNVSVNSIQHDYAQITVPELKFDAATNAQEPESGAEDTRQPVTQLRVEGMGGAITEMTFTPEFFAKLEEVIAQENAKDGKNFRTLAFSQARMSIYFSESSYDWGDLDPNPSTDGGASPLLSLIEEMNAAPNRLGLYTNYKSLSPVSDYAYSYEQNYSTTLAYGGYINRSRGCYVLNITGYLQQLWNSYIKVKEAAGAVYPMLPQADAQGSIPAGDLAAFQTGYEAWEKTVDWNKVANRTVYIGPEAYSIFTNSFGVMQGASTVDNELNSPIRFDLAYNLIK